MASVDESCITQEAGRLMVAYKEKFTFTDPTYHSEYTQRLVGLRQEGLLTDVVLKSHGIQLACHKVALAAASTFFYQLIKAGQLGDIVEMDEVNPSVLESIVNFVYTAEIKISAEHVKELGMSCDHLQLVCLKNVCDDYISQRVEPCNAMALYMYAVKYNMELTRQAARLCLMTRADDVLVSAANAEYESLSQEALIQWISSDDLEVTSEDIVFKLITKWVDADASHKTEACITKVMESIRLPLCSPEFLVTTVQTSLLMQLPKCRKFLEEAISFVVLNQHEKLENTLNIRTRHRKVKRSRLVLMGGVCNGTGSSQCWWVESERQKWKELTTLPLEQQAFPYHFRACVVDSDIIVTGGRQSYNYVSTATAKVWLFNVPSKNWRQLPVMKKCRSAHGIVAVGKSVYVMGGINQSGKLMSVERLDLGKEQWTSMAPLSCGVNECHAFLIDIYIYLVSAQQKKIQRYHVGNDSWQQLADLPKYAYFSAAACINKDIYVVGMSNLCMHYNSSTDMWTKITPMPQDLEYGSAFEYRGRVLLCGGASNYKLDKCKSACKEYDPQSNKWTDATLVLPKQLAGHVLLHVR